MPLSAVEKLAYNQQNVHTRSAGQSAIQAARNLKRKHEGLMQVYGSTQKACREQIIRAFIMLLNSTEAPDFNDEAGRAIKAQAK